MPEEEKDDDDDDRETEVKKVEKTPLEQLREIQDNIQFQYGMLVSIELAKMTITNDGTITN